MNEQPSAQSTEDPKSPSGNGSEVSGLVMRQRAEEEVGLEMRIEDLERENDQLRLWCDLRSQALLDIRQMCEPGSDISKRAGAALCFGPQRHSYHGA